MTDLGPLPAVAFYLPQYHPIPENDEWWGPGFTEWRNVVRARPLFPGHYQPHIPGDLGFYDLRLYDTRKAQTELARAYGISGFCYYHYWFNGRRLLERPFGEVLASGEPDFPFCLCWANEKWTRAWDGSSGHILIDQKYSADDDRRHMRWLATAFEDERYIRVNGKPLFLVYRARHLPDPLGTAVTWREEATQLGVGEIYLATVEAFAEDHADPRSIGFDASVEFQPDAVNFPLRLGFSPRSAWRFRGSLRPLAKNAVYDYKQVIERSLAKPTPEYRRFPCVTPAWDNSPRRATGGARIFHGSTPELYERWLTDVASVEAAQPEPRFVFINAWNEWAEGNHLEPDLRFGRRYLEATARALASALTTAHLPPSGITARGVARDGVSYEGSA
jgi:lipopolysaccharide biosynthesis protein